MYVCLHWVFVAARGLSLVAVSGGYSLLRSGDFSLWASLVVEHGAPSLQASVVVAHGLSSCGSWALERQLSSCGAHA